MIIVTWLLLRELYALKVMLLQLPPLSDAGSVTRWIVEGELELGEKPPKPMRETEEENQKTTKNILAP